MVTRTSPLRGLVGAGAFTTVRGRLAGEKRQRPACFRCAWSWAAIRITQWQSLRMQTRDNPIITVLLQAMDRLEDSGDSGLRVRTRGLGGLLRPCSSTRVSRLLLLRYPDCCSSNLRGGGWSRSGRREGRSGP